MELTGQPAWMTATLAPVDVPATLRRPHPSIAAIRDDTHALPMNQALRGRALRILQGLAATLTRGGHQVETTPVDRWGGSPQGYPSGHLIAVIAGHRFGITVTEQTDRIPHEPTPAELREKARYSWTRIPTHDRVPNGRLNLAINNGAPFRQSSWTDGPRGQLEDYLPQVLHELQLRGNDAEQRRQAAIQRQEEHRQRWEQAMARARDRLTEHHRTQTLRDQASRWDEHRRITDYITAMHTNLAAITDDHDRHAAEEWLRWAQTHHAGLNPLTGTLAMPEPPTPTPENMTPFLDGWSYYPPPTSTWYPPARRFGGVTWIVCVRWAGHFGESRLARLTNCGYEYVACVTARHREGGHCERKSGRSISPEGTC